MRTGRMLIRPLGRWRYARDSGPNRPLRRWRYARDSGPNRPLGRWRYARDSGPNRPLRRWRYARDSGANTGSCLGVSADDRDDRALRELELHVVGDLEHRPGVLDAHDRAVDAPRG